MPTLADSQRSVNPSPLDDERRRLGRLRFCKWLVESGRISDGEPDLCPACRVRPLRRPPLVAAELIERGHPICAVRCACGVLSLPNDGGAA